MYLKMFKMKYTNKEYFFDVRWILTYIVGVLTGVLFVVVYLYNKYGYMVK